MAVLGWKFFAQGSGVSKGLKNAPKGLASLVFRLIKKCEPGNIPGTFTEIRLGKFVRLTRSQIDPGLRVFSIRLGPLDTWKWFFLRTPQFGRRCADCGLCSSRVKFGSDSRAPTS